MNQVNKLQEAILKMPQADIETRHTFCNGVYAREITIPENVCIVGAKHKTEFFMVISQGRCMINGKTFSAPYTGISKIGAKRAIYAIEETVLTTFHPTDETDIEKIEQDIIEPEGLRIANNPLRKVK